MTAAATEAVGAPPRVEEGAGAKIVRFVGKAPVHLLLIVVGVLWLVPTLGLFITSLLAPEDFQVKGWWQVFSEPSKLTFSNYEAVFDDSSIMTALVTTAIVAIGGTVLPIIVGYMTAHYLSYFVEVGQQTVIYLSDPMVDGSNLLGTADLQVSYWLSLHPTFLATTKVVAIVLAVRRHSLIGVRRRS